MSLKEVSKAAIRLPIAAVQDFNAGWRSPWLGGSAFVGLFLAPIGWGLIKAGTVEIGALEHLPLPAADFGYLVPLTVSLLAGVAGRIYAGHQSRRNS